MATPRKEHIIVERHTYAELVLYEVTKDELDQMEKEVFTVGEDFSFFLVGLSVAITIAATLFSVPIDSNRIFYCFVIFLTIGVLMTFFFGVRWFKGRKNFKGVINRIKSRVSTLGEEGAEVDLSDQVQVSKRPGGV